MALSLDLTWADFATEVEAGQLYAEAVGSPVLLLYLLEDPAREPLAEQWRIAAEFAALLACSLGNGNGDGNGNGNGNGDGN